jgi:cbb3-type cytochrome oxidase subunit 3
MALLILEALGALALLLFAVWWTMFSGRRRGERAPPRDEDKGAPPSA